MAKLEGKTALITGVDSNIGHTTAKHLMMEGAYVFTTGRRDLNLAATTNQKSNNITHLQVDLSDSADRTYLFKEIARSKRKLDILFPNAGAAVVESSGMITEDVTSILNVSVKGLFFTVYEALPLMSDGASIIVNASIGQTPELSNAVLMAADAAARSFARDWSVMLQHRHIRVNVVNVGSRETKNTEHQDLTVLSRSVSFGRPSTVQEIAAVVSSLCDPDNDINGTEVVMDGGVPHLRALSTNLPRGNRPGSAEEIAKNIVFLASDDNAHITGTELFVDGTLSKL